MTEGTRREVSSDDNRPACGPSVALPRDVQLPRRTLGEVLMKRHTVRVYRPAPLPLPTLSALLVASGIREAGTALDAYLVVYAVGGLDAGIARYLPDRHELVWCQRGDFREPMVDILQGLAAPRSAALTFVLAADVPESQSRHPGERGLRSVYLDAGYVAQRITLAATAFGLGTLPTPAQQDAPLCQLLGIDASLRPPIYTVTCGWSLDH
jgi:SagB-type dehydrogenase family enzyme